VAFRRCRFISAPESEPLQKKHNLLPTKAPEGKVQAEDCETNSRLIEDGVNWGGHLRAVLRGFNMTLPFV